MLLRVLALYSCGEHDIHAYAMSYLLKIIGRKAKIFLYSLFCLELLSKLGFAMAGQIMAKCM